MPLACAVAETGTGDATVNTADCIRAHAIGVDMSEERSSRSLKIELNSAYDYITRLELRLATAKDEAAKWKRRWIIAFGALLVAVCVIEVLVVWR